MRMKPKIGGKFKATVESRQGVREKMDVGFKYEVVAFRNGKELWREVFYNIVTDQGINDMLDKYLKGSNYTAAHYIGLKGSGSVSASDTMNSHPGWSEVTAYDEATRPQAVWGTVANKSVDNSANRASYTINADNTTIAGAFLSTDNTKGGTAGILLSVGDFSQARTLSSGDVLYVTVTFTGADDGV